MDPELRDLLRTLAVDQNNESHTHVTTYGPHARWLIRAENQETFWMRYCDLVYRKAHGRDNVQPDPLAAICLAEKPQEAMPVISKLTFRFQIDEADDGNWEPYDDDFLQWICQTYQNVILESFQIRTPTQIELVVVVMESESHWYEEDRDTGLKYLVMEVRLQFPYSRIDVGMQNRIIRPRVIQQLRKNHILAKLQRQAIGDWEQIISSVVINEPVMMYGGSGSS